MGGGSPTFEGRRGTKTQRIAIKFGMLVIGLGEGNAASIDNFHRESFFGGGRPKAHTAQLPHVTGNIETMTDLWDGRP